ncbi:MAG: hypothetical protein HDR19_01920 [Lachnospiraceae bacterium]|nr:hypothetical protein [Lachnospiraceae bacterium]
MAEAATNPMQQMEELKKILISLNQIGGVQVINEVQDSFKVMDAQHQVLYQELQDIKQQLNTMQIALNNPKQPQLIANSSTKEKTNNSVIKDLMTGFEKSVSDIGKFISNMKRNVNEKAAETIKDFKAHGVIALSNISEKLGVKEMFKSAEMCFNLEANKAQEFINKLDTIRGEINKAKTHIGNIGRAATGKELKSESEKQGKLFNLLIAPYSKLMQSCQKVNAKIHEAVVNIEKLELKALDAGDHLRKKSVLKKLDKFKEEQQQEPKGQEADLLKTSQLEDKQKGQLRLEDKQQKRDDRSER